MFIHFTENSGSKIVEYPFSVSSVNWAEERVLYNTIISDLFDDPDKILSGMKHLRYKGHEIIVFHILDKQEL